MHLHLEAAITNKFIDPGTHRKPDERSQKTEQKPAVLSIGTYAYYQHHLSRSEREEPDRSERGWQRDYTIGIKRWSQRK